MYSDTRLFGTHPQPSAAISNILRSECQMNSPCTAFGRREDTSFAVASCQQQKAENFSTAYILYCRPCDVSFDGCVSLKIVKKRYIVLPFEWLTSSFCFLCSETCVPTIDTWSEFGEHVTRHLESILCLLDINICYSAATHFSLSLSLSLS